MYVLGLPYSKTAFEKRQSQLSWSERRNLQVVIATLSELLQPEMTPLMKRKLTFLRSYMEA